MKLSKAVMLLVLVIFIFSCAPTRYYDYRSGVIKESDQPPGTFSVSAENIGVYKTASKGNVEGSCFVVYRSGRSEILRGMRIMAFPATAETKRLIANHENYYNSVYGGSIQLKRDIRNIEQTFKQAFPSELVVETYSDSEGKFNLILPQGPWIIWAYMDTKPGTIGAGIIAWAVEVIVNEGTITKVQLFNQNAWHIS